LVLLRQEAAVARSVGMYHHIKNNNILVKEQFGFRHARSTDDASYYLINNILIALNKKNW
jgi:hypothetical protein